MLKRTVDLAGGLVGLALLWPVLLAIAAFIKLGSPGAVFYRGVRIGLHGRPFRIFKFRTMVVDAEKRGGSSTSDDDPRITRIGRLLRKYKLDELPQLLNVVHGEMSLVGPRPEVQHYVDMYTEEEKAILSVKPGITDWATLWNPDEGAVLAGSSDPERTYLEKIRPQKLHWQLEYVRRRSFMVDARILTQTVATIVLRRRPQAFDAPHDASQHGR
jgi:lipopolysaccharide/colanic/teichoic acid biosynthesis glycosyltransferase